MANAYISELGAIRFASVTLTTVRVSSVGRSRRAVVVLRRGRMQRVIGRVLRRVVLRDGGEVDFRIGAPVMAVIRWGRLYRGVVAGCEGSCSRSVGPARITRQRRQSGWIGRERPRRGIAVISELDVSGLVSVNMRMGRISLMVDLSGAMNQVIDRVLRQLVLGDGGEVDSRINGRVMVHAWLERRRGVVPVTARRCGERAVHTEVGIRWGRLRRGVFAG